MPPPRAGALCEKYTPPPRPPLLRGRRPGPGPSKEPGRSELIGAPRRIKTRDQLGRALLRAARRRARRLEPRVPPPVCGPAFGSCSGGASGGDAWASASDTVNTVTSAGAAARLNAASPRRESALRREITSDVLISNLPDYEVDEAQPSLSGRRRRSIALSRLPRARWARSQCGWLGCSAISAATENGDWAEMIVHYLASLTARR